MKPAVAASVLSLLIAVLVPAGQSRAHHPSAGFGAEEAGPVSTISAEPLAKNRWAAGIRADYTKFEEFTDADLLGFAEEDKDVHSIDDQQSVFFSAAFGVTDDLTLGFHVPYIIRRGIREGHVDSAGTPEVHDHGESRGIGDLSLLGQYRFVRQENARFDAALLFGLKTPTGSTKETDRDGERFAAEFQPGSGSWDPLVGAAASRRWDSVSLDGSALWSVSTRGTQETNLGSVLHYGAALSRRFTPAPPDSHDHSSHVGAEGRHFHVSWDLILEAVGEWKQKQTVNGVKDENSGGSVVMFAPGTRLDFHRRWSAYLSAGIPVVQDLNGTQHETRYRAILGISGAY